MNKGTTRREFIGASLAAVALPKALISGAGVKRSKRVLIDPCNQIYLAGIKIKLINLNTGQKFRVKTADDGMWDLDSIASTITNPNGEKFKTTIKPAVSGDLDYAGLEHIFILSPGGAGAKANRNKGHLSLIPLTRPGLALGVDDENFKDKWFSFIRESLFSNERTPENIPEGRERGAITRIDTKKIRLFLGESLSPVEQDFVGTEIENSIGELSAGQLNISSTVYLSSSQEPFFTEQLQPASITVIKRDYYPRPTVRILYDADNPHKIIAALITMDSFTLDTNYRSGTGTEVELLLARHLLQRSVAEVLGYRPTTLLPNRTLLDANYTPQAALARQGIRTEDIILSRVIYGALWLKPGSRVSAKDQITFVSDDL